MSAPSSGWRSFCEFTAVSRGGSGRARGVQISAELDDKRWYRDMLILQATYDALAGETATALSGARKAFEVVLVGPDPRGEARLACTYTHLLLLTGGDVDDVAAGQRGLDDAAAWGIDTLPGEVDSLQHVPGTAPSGSGTACSSADASCRKPPTIRCRTGGSSTWNGHASRCFKGTPNRRCPSLTH